MSKGMRGRGETNIFMTNSERGRKCALPPLFVSPRDTLACARSAAKARLCTAQVLIWSFCACSFCASSCVCVCMHL